MTEQFLVEAVAPRPLAWVTTISDAGIPHAAPFSAFNLVLNSPPTLLLAIQRRPDGSRKRTADNILSSREFSVNFVRHDLLQHLLDAGGPQESFEAPPPCCPFEANQAIRTPRLHGCNFVLECRIVRAESYGSRPADIFWGEIVAAHRDAPESSTGGPRFLGALGFDWFVSEAGLCEGPRPPREEGYRGETGI